MVAMGCTLYHLSGYKYPDAQLGLRTCHSFFSCFREDYLLASFSLGLTCVLLSLTVSFLLCLLVFTTYTYFVRMAREAMLVSSPPNRSSYSSWISSISSPTRMKNQKTIRASTSMAWFTFADTTGQTTGTGDLHDPAQALVSQSFSLSLHPPLSQKSTSILDPNASESGSSSRSILGYCLGSPQWPSPPKPHVGGHSQTVHCGILKMERVSSEARSFS